MTNTHRQNDTDRHVDAARKLWEDNPRRYPEPERVWADWLYGEHPPAHRRAVLEEFASDVIEDHDQAQLVEGGVGGRGLVPAALQVLSSVEVVVVKLGTWLDNARKRAGKLTEQRRADLNALGMRW
ncbi:helicase associated domain-containing protein [Streptomyces sp. NPDC057966]|uniref:helicase associated domain-containing protein n=1 Tax=Streptomyces sp. NPDC057966 TaxID=3346292 RepID=UPI0036EA9B9E